ncbi:galactokinase [Salinigranum rubrum]|uniref:Galactokinase n=1 Tax=Salinigranum rubrum TaxID=755307 RepID=A0A2I8VIL7_9EURY|nr:galactokinase [Salinigranum rubrum]AUV81783.1 galactokinase [Salinigranum rubrum]
MTAGEARQAFEAAYDREPTAVASAPGRVNLVGGHTDYNGGLVLPMAIDRRTAVAAAPRDDDRFRLRSTDVEGRVVVDGLPDEPLGSEDEAWANYPLGVLVELAREGLFESRGLDLLVAGDVPRGAGLSSSAALEVATAAAAYAVDSPTHELPRRALAEAAWRAETGFVGLDCGIMDQYASACCRTGEVLFLDCRSRETRGVRFGDREYRVVVVDTRVEHELASSAYNDRVRECAEAVEQFDALLGGVESLRDVDRDALVAHAASLPGVLRRRTRHVVTENERVRAAVDALEAEDVGAVGDCMFESHASLRDDYEVSCVELDTVVELAWETAGVVGARMTGGGFGGSVVALVRSDAVEDFRAHVDTEYTERAGVDVEPRTFVCSPAEGVRLE